MSRTITELANRLYAEYLLQPLAPPDRQRICLTEDEWDGPVYRWSNFDEQSGLRKTGEI